jgi:methylated-DNA-[protein]-cysteine S-methyltransferase
MSHDRTIVIATLDSAVVGPIRVAATEQGICALAYARWHDRLALAAWESADYICIRGTNPAISACAQWLKNYDRAKNAALPDVDLRFLPAFTQRVLRATARLEFGESLSYAQLAGKSGSPRGARAVGQAMRRNPIPLIIPCHRVMAANAKLGGFTPGLELKRTLLAHEKIAWADS